MVDFLGWLQARAGVRARVRERAATPIDARGRWGGPGASAAEKRARAANAPRSNSGLAEKRCRVDAGITERARRCREGRVGDPGRARRKSGCATRPVRSSTALSTRHPARAAYACKRPCARASVRGGTRLRKTTQGCIQSSASSARLRHTLRTSSGARAQGTRTCRHSRCRPFARPPAGWRGYPPTRCARRTMPRRSEARL